MANSNRKVEFHSLVDSGFLRNRQKLKTFIERIFRLEKTRLGSVKFIFCADVYLKKINQQFLGRDYLTDIISFDLASSGPVDGEVYISLDRIRENARFFKRPLVEEIHRVIFHGVLHLCGYDDNSSQKKLAMTRKEDQYLSLYLG